MELGEKKKEKRKRNDVNEISNFSFLSLLLLLLLLVKNEDYKGLTCCCTPAVVLFPNCRLLLLCAAKADWSDGEWTMTAKYYRNQLKGRRHSSGTPFY